MPARSTYLDDLAPLLPRALAGDPGPLEGFLVEHSNLPGPRGNLELAHAFADTVVAAVTDRGLPGAEVAELLDRWAALPVEDVPSNDPREILPFCSALAYGAVGAARPDWWSDESAKLRRAAVDGRWRTREMVATGVQRVLAADWPRGYATVIEWASDPDPLVVRAAAAAVAEPALLREASAAVEAVAVQAAAATILRGVPAERRRDQDVRVLRKALGYTLSVVAVAAPDAGFRLLEELAAQPDPDLAWIVRENLRKKRLQAFPDRLERVEAVRKGAAGTRDGPGSARAGSAAARSRD